MNAGLVSLLARPAFMYHAEPSGVYQSCRAGMMHECSTGKLLASAAFIHYADKGQIALLHYAAFKGLI